MIYLKRASLLVIFILYSSISLTAQSDCIQKAEELDEPFQIDTLRVIDPETYEESIKATFYYIDDKSESVKVHDKEGNEERQVQIKHEFNKDIEPKKVIEKGNRKIYYYKEGDCYKIYKIEKRWKT